MPKTTCRQTIIVTGGAGFIGSNIVEHLNRSGQKDVVVVDDLSEGQKFFNIRHASISDYLSSAEFLELIEADDSLAKPRAIVHMGATTSTTEWNGALLMQNNFTYTKKLLHWCQRHRVPLVYASSASVYGLGLNGFREERFCEAPINMYAYSKLMTDEYVRRLHPELVSQVVGLRFFNVYGPGEFHKGAMASPVHKFYRQVHNMGIIELFEGFNGVADGEQTRDFVSVQDCAQVCQWMLDHPEVTGVFNVGTGQARTFNHLADAMLGRIGYGDKRFIPFPDILKGAYQHHTQADLSNLRLAGCDLAFTPIEAGIDRYCDWMTAHGHEWR